MDPWSKVDYSRIIREASMVEEKLPEVNPPPDRVLGRGLLALPILEARRRRKRGEIAKKGSFLRPPPMARHQGAWAPSGGPLDPFRFFRKLPTC